MSFSFLFLSFPFLSFPFLSFPFLSLDRKSHLKLWVLKRQFKHWLAMAWCLLSSVPIFFPCSPRTSREIYSSLSIKGQDEPRQLSETITHSCSLSVPPCAIPLERSTPIAAFRWTPTCLRIQLTYNTVLTRWLTSLSYLH